MNWGSFKLRYWLGFDIGGTKIAAHLVNESNGVHWHMQRPTAKGTTLIPAVIEVVDLALQSIDQANDTLAGIGMGIPGKVVPELGEIHLATNLDIETPIPIGPKLSERYGVPVYIENDVRLAAVGVQHSFELDDFAYISIGTGLAAGFILDGKLFRGKNGLAGEIGHIVETFDGVPRILENTISGPGLMRQALEAGCNASTPAELFSMADSGSEKAKVILQNMFHHLARAIQWIALTFDINKVVLGGGITQIGESFECNLRQSVAILREQSKVAQLLLTDDKLIVLPKSHNPGLWGATHLVKNMTGLK
ncbi:MAG: ROK family protein [Anaerolineae bacterium]